MKINLHNNDNMKISLHIILAFFLFFTSLAMATFFQQPYLSLPLCLYSYHMLSTHKKIAHLSLLLYMLEQFIYHSSFGLPLLYLIPVSSLTRFLNRVTLISRLWIRLFALTLCLMSHMYLLASFLETPLPSYNHFLCQFCVSIGVLFALSFLLDRKSDTH